jgi:hypothetical protein
LNFVLNKIDGMSTIEYVIGNVTRKTSFREYVLPPIQIHLPPLLVEPVRLCGEGLIDAV